jgi:hypothetical protein
MSNVKLETLSAGTTKMRSGNVDFEVTALSASEVQAVSARTGNYMYARAADRLFAMAKDLNNNGKLDAGDSVIYSFGDPHFNQVTLTGNEGSSLKDIVEFCGYATDFDVQSNYILHTKDAQALVDTEVLSETYTMNDKITWEVDGANGGKGALSFDFNDTGGIDMGTGQLVTKQSLAADPTGDATVQLLYDPSKIATVYMKDADSGKALIVADGVFVNRQGVDTANKLIAPQFGAFANASGGHFGDGNNEGAVSGAEETDSMNMGLTASDYTSYTEDDEDEEVAEKAFQLTLDVTAKVVLSK